MSESQEGSDKESTQEQTEQPESKPEETPKPSRPRVGTPIGQSTPPRPQVGTPIGTQPPSGTSQTTRPVVGTPRPTVGTPVGTPRPTVGTPVGAPKATVGTPIGSPRPTVGTPVGTPKTGQPAAAAAPRPAVATPRPASVGVSRPAAPSKPPESKAEISRRNFIKVLAVAGGIVAVGQFGVLEPYLTGSVGGSTAAVTQVLTDSATGATLLTTNTNISTANSWTTFIYPYTGNANIDNDTFRQWVIIHLPKGWTAGTFGTVDPISGDTFIALSRVCLHLWCLWSYDPTADRGICPCHGSQYLPGGVAGSVESTEAGLAVAGPASLQTPPNNWLAHATIKIASDGTISATNIVGQVGCGLNC